MGNVWYKITELIKRKNGNVKEKNGCGMGVVWGQKVVCGGLQAGGVWGKDNELQKITNGNAPVQKNNVKDRFKRNARKGTIITVEQCNSNV